VIVPRIWNLSRGNRIDRPTALSEVRLGIEATLGAKVMRCIGILLMGMAFLTPVGASAAEPDLKGSWSCDPTPILIRNEWTTLVYKIEVSEQRDALFKATIQWTLPESAGVEGNQQGKNSFSGTVEAFGIFDFNGETFDIVAYKDGHRHHGRLSDANTMLLVGSETGDDAWVSRNRCHRQEG